MRTRRVRALAAVLLVVSAAAALGGCGKVDDSAFTGSVPTKDTVAAKVKWLVGLLKELGTQKVLLICRTREMVEDISERKLIEEQRERLAALVDASPDFIGCADPQTAQVTYINTGGRKMCGIGDDEEIGELTLGQVTPLAVMAKQVRHHDIGAAGVIQRGHDI